MEEVVVNGWSEAQADLRRLFEESGHPMWIDEDLKVVAVNQAALSTTDTRATSFSP